jgi:hypothetical protein
VPSQAQAELTTAALGVLALLALGCAAPREATPPQGPPAAPARELFRFHVDFWANLNEVLLHEALLPRPGYEGPKSLAHHSVAPVASLGVDGAAQWRDAIAYYDAYFSTQNTFEPQLVDGSRFLTARASEPSLPASGLADEWRRVLIGAAPGYRATFWAEHERGDRAYIEAIRPALATHGDWMAHRLEAIYRTAWPPEPVFVEVTPAVPPFGASTVGEPPFTGAHAPLITVSSVDPGYAGETGLEMIFHEASHLLVDKVQAALDASAGRQGRKLPDRLWHFVVFYTAGHVLRERFGAGYVPYAERPANRVFTGPFASYVPILERTWQPYLDGHVDLETAVDAIVAAFGGPGG